MSMVNKKQISRLYAGYIFVSNITVSVSTANITSALTTAASTAGYNGGSVSVANSSGETSAGFIVSGMNRVEVYDNLSQKPIYSAVNGEKVYGRLTYSASTYTLTLYTFSGGVQSTYNAGGTAVDIFVPYRFYFKDLSTDFFIMPKQRFVYNDFSDNGNQGRTIDEDIAVSAPNTLATLSYTPTSGTKVILFVNGKAEVNVGGSAPFSVSSNVITWNETNAGYALATTDTVSVHYKTLE